MPLHTLRTRLDLLRADVPIWPRILIASLMLGLLIATYAPVVLAALGLPVQSWEVFTFHTCGPFCHQLSARSFHLAGHIFPLCVRCTGMWIGITLGIALGLFVKLRERWIVGIPISILATAASYWEHLREESTQVGWPWFRFFFGFIIFAALCLAVSFDILAVLTAILRKIRRIVTGVSSA